MTIAIKRVYEESTPGDGARILVDRLWPRGVSKERAKLDLWLKDIAPSTALREWFGHDPEKWVEFQKKYKIELANNNEPVAELKKIVRQNKMVTLLYAAKDEEHNEAVVIANLFSKK